MTDDQPITRPMKILQVVPYFPPDRIGGVGEVAANLHRALQDQSHDSRVLTTGTSDDDPRVIRLSREPAGFILRSAFAAGMLKNVDLVHCHHGECLGLLAMNRIRRINVPVLITYHCSCRDIGRAHRPYRLAGKRLGWDRPAIAQRFVRAPIRHAMDKVALRLSDQANFISRSSAYDILGAERGMTADVIYNGVPDPGSTDTSDACSQIEPMELLYVGTSSHRKRTEMLPLVLAEVRKSIPDARLRLIGFDLHQQVHLQSSFGALNLLTAIDVVGPKLSNQLGPYYAASRVLLVPSAYEGLPMVILEAQRAGLPCVATHVSGHPEVITDRHNGLLVGLDNPKDMAARCVELIENSTLWKSISDGGKAVVKSKFSINHQVAAYLDLYRRLARPMVPQGVEAQ